MCTATCARPTGSVCDTFMTSSVPTARPDAKGRSAPDAPPTDRYVAPVADAPVDDRPCVVPLTDPASLDASLVGAKAANLARLATVGLATLPGFVITTAATTVDWSDHCAVPVQQHWAALDASTDAALVVRSSSTVEDATTSSMAGRFTSVLDVRGWDAFRSAVDRVVASAAGVGRPAPIAVLVQRQIGRAHV